MRKKMKIIEVINAPTLLPGVPANVVQASRGTTFQQGSQQSLSRQPSQQSLMSIGSASSLTGSQMSITPTQQVVQVPQFPTPIPVIQQQYTVPAQSTTSQVKPQHGIDFVAVGQAKKKELEEKKAREPTGSIGQSIIEGAEQLREELTEEQSSERYLCNIIFHYYSILTSAS